MSALHPDNSSSPLLREGVRWGVAGVSTAHFLAQLLEDRDRIAAQSVTAIARSALGGAEELDELEDHIDESLGMHDVIDSVSPTRIEIALCRTIADEFELGPGEADAVWTRFAAMVSSVPSRELSDASDVRAVARDAALKELRAIAVSEFRTFAKSFLGDDSKGDDIGSVEVAAALRGHANRLEEDMVPPQMPSQLPSPGEVIEFYPLALRAFAAAEHERE